MALAEYETFIVWKWSY